MKTAHSSAKRTTPREQDGTPDQEPNFCLIPPYETEKREEKELSAALDLRCVVNSLAKERAI